MEMTPHGFLEELLQPPRRDNHTWVPLSSGVDDFISNEWCFDSLDETVSHMAAPASYLGLISSTPVDQFLVQTPGSYDCLFSDQSGLPYVEGWGASELDSTSYTKNDHNQCLVDQDEDHFGQFGGFDEMNTVCSGMRIGLEQESRNAQVPMITYYGEKKGTSSFKSRKVEGQPSKNLMAERRRRKRLNDRLSMLRSIVPKISKMDRTSILGDTIDYMKELLERVNKLKEEENKESATETTALLKSLSETKSNGVLVRNSPKFNVERRDSDTRIDVSCAVKPGILLSTVSSLEALGLEIQQCVISCFNEFSVQARCSDEDEHNGGVSPEDIKQALFKTAGYGGRSL